MDCGLVHVMNTRAEAFLERLTAFDIILELFELIYYSGTRVEYSIF